MGHVLSVGLDLVEVSRIEKSLERFGDRFLERVFCEQEIFYCQAMKRPGVHLAARFAAKEAASKCLGTGIGQAANWKDLEVVRRASGAPDLVLSGAAAQTAQVLGIDRILISLTHTEHYAAASAVAVGKNEGAPAS
ncbi:MAG: holo-ACP synthase [Verrucomicrobiales bacterium]